MKELRDICMYVCEVAADTGRFIQGEAAGFSEGDIVTKDIHDFVSYVDIESEKKIINSLGDIIPGAGFLAEEGTSQLVKSRFNWIIDPLDGTTNFMHGLPPYSISIALTDSDDIVIGVVHEIVSGDTFYSWKNGGAWLNGERIKVSETEKIENCLIATGFPFKNYSRLGPYLHCLEYFIRNTRGVRRMGSAAIDLSYVACGRFDAFFEYNLNPWDVSAGILLIREAGGVVSDYSGEMERIDGSEIVASNNMIATDFRKKVSNFMCK